ncbi:Aldo/keto reductase [Lophiostoma macrostomum CBS 122681]|uniref:Aldo/keto reductase n=1 Tax=Lophiostoma macrostomum CBS 122681 TaxID=1314788 RepID=A0A6A6SNK4_9PLEO|nr:Aldo/keto reductase [Lophiostoma macrostomum CBS 122681]
MVIVTKLTTHYRKHDLGPNLEKLRTSYIDILYLHWWDHTTSIEEIMDSLHVLVEQVKVLYLGLSVSRWSVIMRDSERGFSPMARHFRMVLAPWDALGSGKFQSRKAIEERKQIGEPFRSIYGSDQSEDEAKMSEALCTVAAEPGIKYSCTYPIVAGRKVEHLRGSMECLKITMTEKQIKHLEGIIPFNRGCQSNLIGPDPKVVGKASRILVAGGSFSFAIAK